MVTKVSTDPAKAATASRSKQKPSTSLTSTASKGSSPPELSLAAKKRSPNNVLGRDAPPGPSKAMMLRTWSLRRQHWTPLQTTCHLQWMPWILTPLLPSMRLHLPPTLPTRSLHLQPHQRWFVSRILYQSPLMSLFLLALSILLVCLMELRPKRLQCLSKQCSPLR